MAPSTDNMVKGDSEMSFDDKLAYIDKEIRLLQRFCLDSGCSPQHIERCAEPFFTPIRSARRKKLRCHLLIVAAAVAVFSALLYIDPAYRLMASTGRLAYIKILPYWDWSQLFDLNCLVSNPLYSDDLKEDDCKSCASNEAIERVSDINMDYFGEEYLKKDVPVIIEDGMKDWPEQNVTIEQIKMLYLRHKILMDYSVCNVTSSIPFKHDNHRQILKDIPDDHFYLSWENCHIRPGKAFRAEFYHIPYFMPKMVEVFATSWLLMSRGRHKEGMEPHRIPLNKQMLILLQLKGEVKIFIEADVLCKDKCQPLTAILSAGQIFVTTLTDVLYDVLYLPYGAEENISVGIAGNFD